MNLRSFSKLGTQLSRCKQCTFINKIYIGQKMYIGHEKTF